MGGRGSSSGMGPVKNDLNLSRSEIDELTKSSMDFIKKLPPSVNPIGTREDFGEKSESEIERKVQLIYERGFSGLEDGTILLHNPKNKRNYIIKQGDRAVMYYFKPTTLQYTLQIKDGKVIGERGEQVKEISLDNEKKKRYLKYAASRWFLTYSV